ncbi:hypothetical protein HDU84_000034 [Entophlyctis sp. JEL0112]|nr:hypothetical protein HDU84_000034 [Entophlyctis sp. JEL0112]
MSSANYPRISSTASGAPEQSSDFWNITEDSPMPEIGADAVANVWLDIQPAPPTSNATDPDDGASRAPPVYDVFFPDDDVSSFAARDGGAYPNGDSDQDHHREPVITKSHQLNHIQSIFNDSQKIAYVGLCYLEIHSQRERRERAAGAPGVSKTASAAYEAWAARFMQMLYAFLDVNEAEQSMISNLALHGLVPSDLSRSLLDDANAALERLKEMRAQDPGGFREPGVQPAIDDVGSDIRYTILSHLFIVCICDGFYDARSRSLLRAVAAHLNIDWWAVSKLENTISEQLRLQDAESHGAEEVKLEDRIINERNKKDSQGRWLYMGLATIGGAAVIGVTAGLAAPLIASGIASALATFNIAGGVGAGVTAFMGGSAGIAIIASSGASIGGGLTGYKMAKRTRGIEEFEFVRLEEALVSIRANKKKREKLRAKRNAVKSAEVKDVKKETTSAKSVDSESLTGEDATLPRNDERQEGSLEVTQKQLSSLQVSAGNSGSLARRVSDERSLNLAAPIIFTKKDGASSEVEDDSEIATEPRSSVLISIAGWVGSIDSRDDFTLPFSTLTPGIHGEQYALVWETNSLIELGYAVRMLVSEVTSFLVQQGIQYFLLPVLMAGLTGPLWMMKLTYMVDNPWGNGLTKARKAGRILADTLLSRIQGNRPVTLVGFSLGARVIYYCLLELASRGEAAFNIVEEAYMFGTPVMASTKEWRAISSVVSGRLVNGYLTNDWVLSMLYRASSAFLADVAGLNPVQNMPGIENYNLDSVLKGGHLEYRSAMPRILKHVGFSVDDEYFDDGEKEAEQDRLDKEAQMERMKNEKEQAKEEALRRKQEEYEAKMQKRKEEEELKKSEAAARKAEAAAKKAEDLARKSEAAAVAAAKKAAAEEVRKAAAAEAKSASAAPASSWKSWFGSSKSVGGGSIKTGGTASASSSSVESIDSIVMDLGEDGEEFLPFEIKEIQSTLPPLVVSIAGTAEETVSDGADRAARGEVMFEFGDDV